MLKIRGKKKNEYFESDILLHNMKSNLDDRNMFDLMFVSRMSGVYVIHFNDKFIEGFV